VTSIRISQALSTTAAATQPSALRRRALSVTVASVGLLLAAPLMAVIALLIKLTSRGPVFFQQTRIGLDRRGGSKSAGSNRRGPDCGGKPFVIYKFRTMATNGYAWNGDGNEQVWAKPNDPRVTRIGRWLRLYRLDELPQLLNVLRGDMDIVGPRPEQPAIFAQLRTQIERYQERQRVRPGITGWAQVNLHYDTSVESARDKVSYDLEYVERQSVLEDLRIMLRTVPVVVLKRGAW
jgi:lipopolysaccharide/colanic/teichoic acid biosynthesis glycosyltransferase